MMYKLFQGDYIEGVYWRTSYRYSALHNRGKCYCKAGGEEIWSVEEYGTYGCDNIERYKSKLIWAIE